jgi:hypothetical protein
MDRIISLKSHLWTDGQVSEWSGEMQGLLQVIVHRCNLIIRFRVQATSKVVLACLQEMKIRAQRSNADS